MNNALSKSILLAAVSILSPFAQAAPVDETASLPNVSTVGGAEIFNLGTSLVVVILAIVVVGWIYSRMQGIGHHGNDVINIVASRPLGPKERILLIEIAEMQLLVGMTASQVQTLHVFDQPVVAVAPATRPAGFAQRLRSALKEIAK